LEDGPPRFPPDCSCPAVLGCFSREYDLSYTGLSPSMAGHSRTVPLNRTFVTRRRPCRVFREIPRPQFSNASTLALNRFRLFPVRSPLLGESLFAFFSSRYLDVSVPWVRCPWLFIHHGMAGTPCAGCPIRRSPGQSLLAANRSFSQLSTSFFASHCLGIHRAPFVA
jgi:hypothetical protein